MHPLLEMLQNSDFASASGVNTSKVLNSDPDDLRALVSQAEQLTDIDIIDDREPVAFEHTASLGLGGSIYPCSEVECRLRNVRELSQFAAFYSDRVLTKNFFDDTASFPINSKRDLDLFRTRLVEDIQVIVEAWPLIESGRIVPVTSPDLCHDCLARHTFGNPKDRRLRDGFEHIATRLRNECEIFVERQENDWYSITVKGPSDLVEHGEIGSWCLGLPKELRRMPQIAKRIDQFEDVKLSKTARRKLGHEYIVASDIFGSLLFELATTAYTGSSYLTGSSYEVAFLRRFLGNGPFAARGNAVYENLPCLVPFLSELDAAEIEQIRQDNEDAFLLFRRRLNEALDSSMEAGEALTPQRAKQIYGDVIEPGLANVDQALKTAQRSHRKGAVRSTIAHSAVIGFGWFSGILPAGLAELAASVGLIHLSGNVLTSALGGVGADEEAVRQDMYFLWQVRKHA